jgi:hypothetical protein
MEANTYDITVTNGDGKLFTLAAAIKISTSEYHNYELYAGNRSSSGYLDGSANKAKFNSPRGLATDGTYLYIADYSNHLIRKIELSSGEVSTVAGQERIPGGVDGIGTNATFYSPRDLAINGTDLYIADYSGRTIRKIDLTTNAVSTYAGSYNLAGDTNATGTSARFSNPTSMTILNGNLYITDYIRHVIRKIDLSNDSVTTFAGSPGAAGVVDNTGGAARFYNPTGITNDGTNLYVTSIRDVMRKITSAAVVTTVAGAANSANSTDGIGTIARFSNPQGISANSTTAFIADGAHTIREIALSDNTVTTVSGTYSLSGSTDATGTASSFYTPYDVEVIGTDLYVADSNNHNIRKIETSTHEVTTFAGLANPIGSRDGSGELAKFNDIVDGTVLDKSMYLTDTINCLIRKVDLETGTVKTIVGASRTCAYTDGIGTAARSGSPWAITNDGTYVYFTENAGHRIRRYNPSNDEVITIAGSGTAGGNDAIGTLATFNNPRGIATDGTSLYVGDYAGHVIRKIDITSRTVTTIAGSYSSAGNTNGNGASARFNQPSGLSIIGNQLYVSERNASRIRKIDLTTNNVSTVAGLYNNRAFVDGASSSARFNYIEGITTDGTYLYVADRSNYAIRKITPSTGFVETLIGSPSYPYDSGANTTIENAKVHFPRGVIWSKYGLFITTRTGIFRAY